MIPASILCAKCGAASFEPRPECAKCGGRNARICGGCGNQNSLAKNFCDKCGNPLASLGPVAPPPQARPSAATDAHIPATVVHRLPASPPRDVQKEAPRRGMFGALRALIQNLCSKKY